MSTKAMMGVAFALTAVLASPAFAQTTPVAPGGDASLADSYEQQLRQPHSVHPNWDVYDDRGRYRGTDPDPFIRDQLERCREC
jgi:hypothetical protein